MAWKRPSYLERKLHHKGDALAVAIFLGGIFRHHGNISESVGLPMELFRLLHPLAHSCHQPLHRGIFSEG